MANKIDVEEAMDALRIVEMRICAYKKHLSTVLKEYALYEVAALCKKHPGKEVLFTSLLDETALYVSGVPRKTSDLNKRFDTARKKYGHGSYPLGVFLGVDNDVAFRPMAVATTRNSI